MRGTSALKKTKDSIKLTGNEGMDWCEHCVLINLETTRTSQSKSRCCGQRDSGRVNWWRSALALTLSGCDVLSEPGSRRLWWSLSDSHLPGSGCGSPAGLDGQGQRAASTAGSYLMDTESLETPETGPFLLHGRGCWRSFYLKRQNYPLGLIQF